MLTYAYSYATNSNPKPHMLDKENLKTFLTFNICLILILCFMNYIFNFGECVISQMRSMNQLMVRVALLSGLLSTNYSLLGSGQGINKYRQLNDIFIIVCVISLCNGYKKLNQ